MTHTNNGSDPAMTEGNPYGTPFDKVYIWAFPGIGKSHITDSRICDVDCERFKYVLPDDTPDNLHKTGEWGHVERDPQYPNNYLSYIKSLDADIVLLNCHISLLDQLDKERLILVYPTEALKDEYMKRYVQRGDNESFLAYMEDNFHDMVSTIRHSPYHTCEVTAPHTNLQTLLEGGSLMNQFMTKPELTTLFKEALDLGTIEVEGTAAGKAPDELAQMVFEGQFHIDLEKTKNELAAKNQSMEEELVKTERRGGLSRGELADKIMQGIVNGALGIRYAEIAPYSHGYEVTFGDGGRPGSTAKFTNRWNCYGGDLFSVPYTVADLIAKGKQHDEVFGDRCGLLDIHKMLQAIEETENRKITSFTPEKDTDFVRATSSNHYPYRSSVANVMDVHAGKGLDGIVQHHYHGDYATMTPVKQNQLVEMLVCLKGFCLDCIDRIDIDPTSRQNMIDYLKGQGTDISTPEKLREWIQANPSKCGLAENRQPVSSLSSQIRSASKRAEEANKTSDEREKPFAPER